MCWLFHTSNATELATEIETRHYYAISSVQLSDIMAVEPGSYDIRLAASGGHTQSRAAA